MIARRTALWKPALALAAGLLAQRPAPAAAQPSADDRALATALFNQGKELMSRGRVGQACLKFAESERLDPSGGTLLNLALCHEKEGRVASAWTEFTEARSRAKQDGRAEREKAAEEHIRELEPRLSMLTIVVPEGARVPGLVIRRDGTVIGEVVWSNPMPVDGGEHTIEASAPGKTPVTLRIQVDPERDARSIAVPELAPAVAGARTGDRGVARALGFVVGGMGVSEIGVAIGFTVHASNRHAQSVGECPADRCSQLGARLEADAGHWADAATVLTVVGIASASLGAYLVIDSFVGGAVSAEASLDGLAMRGTFRARGR